MRVSTLSEPEFGWSSTQFERIDPSTIRTLDPTTASDALATKTLDSHLKSKRKLFNVQVRKPNKKQRRPSRMQLGNKIIGMSDARFHQSPPAWKPHIPRPCCAKSEPEAEPDLEGLLMCHESSPQSFTTEPDVDCAQDVGNYATDAAFEDLKEECRQNSIVHRGKPSLESRSICAFVEFIKKSRLFGALLQASSFCDAHCIASILVLLHRGGWNLEAYDNISSRDDVGVAVAFMLTLKMDDESLDRCVEKALR